jgi:hypothetical protein
LNEKILRFIKIEDDEQEGETPEPPKEQEYSFIEVRVSAHENVNKNQILWVSETSE